MTDHDSGETTNPVIYDARNLDSQFVIDRKSVV